MGELLSLMSATPMLEQLVLGDCLKGLNSGPGQTMQVTARNLKCLKFFGLADVLREGLSHIQLLRPLTHLHIENRNPDITSFSYFLPCISTWHIPKLNSSEGNRSQYELSLARTRASRQLSDSSYRVRILVPQGWDATAEHITRELCVETVLSTAGLRDIFQYLFTLLPIRLLTSFTISTAGWQGFGLRSTLKNATSLRSLSIAPPDLVQVASLLSCRSVGDMPARNLEELTLDMELPSVFNPGPQPHATFTGLEELRECILLRRAYGHPVHRVVFKYCTPEDSYAFAGMQWEKVEDLGIELVFIVEVGCGRFVQNEKYSLQSFLALASRA
ncbi:hypothetical protein CONPUDRAFT_153676 [Coniophora puteana RWD-64-598 SS2]|uniref:F-box domain-containing protein n=1 Tax=Coniophora puteana (strain RWD-64-598) TaxID=741705 RepID=A0A5M3MPN1_CONPW|nr:uncharacterized protein CONPUDRAFT_153676 [Coniophora puteana RWD-64-598 SS2]EIW81128.1 hypothetical protein CONPUDRAFT_153676 [Coniophora puteana RWD-64-598 SS2]